MKKTFITLFQGTVLSVIVALWPITVNATPTVWLGNDMGGNVFATDTSGAVEQVVAGIGVTGIAYDGTSLYFADRTGNYTRRTTDGQTVLGSFSVASTGTGEDLAWDSSRNRIWRIVHNNRLQMINPITGTEDSFFSLPTGHSGFSTLGGLGVAYDGLRDLLYVSYCDAGCSSLAHGLVQIFDPDTGLITGDLFSTGFGSGGLGYDPVSDSLWIGDSSVVRNVALDGTVLSSFVRPGPAGFPDGLEFIPHTAPEPSTLLLLGSGLAGVAFWQRRRA